MKILTLNKEELSKIKELELKILEEFDRICTKHQLNYTIAYGTLIGAVRHGGFIPWDDDIDVRMPREDYNKLKYHYKDELGENFFYQTHYTDPEYYYLMDKIRLNGTVFKESFVSKYNIHHGVYIDVFPVDKIPNSKFLQILQYYTFHFFRIGLQSKYLMTEARHGKKKIMASLLRVIYAPFSLDYLYRKAQEIATKYNNDESCKQVACFFSAAKKKDRFEKELALMTERRAFEDITVSAVVGYDKMLTQIYGDYMKFPPIEKRTSIHTVVDLII